MYGRCADTAHMCSEELAGRPRALLAPTPLAPAPLVDSKNQHQETSFPAEKFRTFVLKFRWVVQEPSWASWGPLGDPSKSMKKPRALGLEVNFYCKKKHGFC